MRPTLAYAALTAAAAPHEYGHVCHDGLWYAPHLGTRSPCPPLASLRTVREQVQHLHEQVHTAAHNDTAATAVAEGMTGLVMADLPDEDREGWVTTARMAIEALAHHLDRDPVLEARQAAAVARLTGGSGGAPLTSLAEGPRG